MRALVVVLLFLTGNTTQTSSPTVQQGVMGQLAENKLLLPLPTLVARMIKRSPQEWRHSGCPGATASSTCPSLPVLPLDAIHLAPACWVEFQTASCTPAPRSNLFNTASAGMNYDKATDISGDNRVFSEAKDRKHTSYLNYLFREQKVQRFKKGRISWRWYFRENSCCCAGVAVFALFLITVVQLMPR